MSEIREIATGYSPSKRDMLEELEKMRQDVLNGVIVAFSAAGVQPDDRTMVYWASVDSMTMARITGCAGQALHMLYAGEV